MLTVVNSFKTLIAKVSFSSVNFGDDSITIIGKQHAIINGKYLGEARLELHPVDNII